MTNGYEKKSCALREHADYLQKLAQTWSQVIENPLTGGEVQLSYSELGPRGHEVSFAYQNMLTMAQKYTGEVYKSLLNAAEAIRIASRTYDKSDAEVREEIARLRKTMAERPQTPMSPLDILLPRK
ncbi:hypothetical protein [Actinomadura rupiterrae]|uniref:hypothetical protein n=1 Tax=Actinomadura rupiterrae TaxID=559627 RepID=UPI0020A290A4|nr:hypothetical protein [Actinomadura rupiterrae]MCP2341985.1 hypothetical protein [Actinomadura rupiterrae]